MLFKKYPRMSIAINPSVPVSISWNLFLSIERTIPRMIVGMKPAYEIAVDRSIMSEKVLVRSAMFSDCWDSDRAGFGRFRFLLVSYFKSFIKVVLRLFSLTSSVVSVSSYLPSEWI